MSPDTTHVVAPEVEQLAPPGLATTEYLEIAEPPSFDGADQLTVAWWLPTAAVTSIGVPGVVFGITADDGVDAAPVPAPLVAVTLKV